VAQPAARLDRDRLAGAAPARGRPPGAARALAGAAARAPPIGRGAAPARPARGRAPRRTAWPGGRLTGTAVGQRGGAVCPTAGLCAVASCWIPRSSSFRSWKPRSWSKAGGAPTTPAARTRPWAASRSRHSLPYRRLRRPLGPRHRSRSCTRCRAGPPRGGRPRRGDHVAPAPAPLGKSLEKPLDHRGGGARSRIGVTRARFSCMEPTGRALPRRKRRRQELDR
jgi:hypothetical protein